jgi:hypothetical protein
MYKFLEIQTLRQTLERDKQDLRRFLENPGPNAESIVMLKRIIREKEAKIALLEPH